MTSEDTQIIPPEPGPLHQRQTPTNNQVSYARGFEE